MKKEPKSVKVSARITVRADEKLSWEAQKAKLSKSRYLEQLILKKKMWLLSAVWTNLYPP